MRYLLSTISILVILILLLTSCSFRQTSPEGPVKLTSEQLIEGTEIENTKDEVQSAIKGGKESILMSEVLSGTGEYICTLRYREDYIALKKKDDKIRQDLLWDDKATTSYLIEDKLYRFSLQYQQWTQIDYDPESETSTMPYTIGILSHKELQNLELGSVLCIKQNIDDAEFEFPQDNIFDISRMLEELGEII